MTLVAVTALLLLLAIAPAAQPALAADQQFVAESTLVSHSYDGADPNLGYLFAVFMVTWAGFFGYLLWISRRQNNLRREIDRLRKLLGLEGENEKTQADAGG